MGYGVEGGGLSGRGADEMGCPDAGPPSRPFLSIPRSTAFWSPERDTMIQALLEEALDH